MSQPIEEPDGQATVPAALGEAAERRRRWTGRAMIVLAAVLWSSNGLFAKADIFENWPLDKRGILQAFWRALFAGLVLLPAVRRPRWKPALAPMALSFTVMNITFLSSMALTTAANAIWLQSTAPLWVFLLGLLFFQQSIDRRDLVTLAFGLLGAATIVSFELLQGGARQGQIGVGLGLVSGVMFGLVVLFMRRLRDENSAWLVALNHLVAAAIMGPYVFSLGIWPDGFQLAVLVAFGGLQMGLPYLLFSLSLRRVSSQEAAGLCLLEPILSPLWVLLAWGESPRPWTAAGAVLILLGLGIRYSQRDG